MREVIIRLDSIPIAWARPGQGMFGRYDTQKRIKRLLGALIRPQLSKHTTFPSSVELKATFIFPIPKSKKGREKLGLFHISKPDLDNLLKFYLDLCKDYGVYKDDCQICFIMALKRYTAESEDGYIGAILHFTETSQNIQERLVEVRAKLEELNGRIAAEPGGVRVS